MLICRHVYDWKIDVVIMKCDGEITQKVYTIDIEDRKSTVSPYRPIMTCYKPFIHFHFNVRYNFPNLKDFAIPLFHITYVDF